MNPCSCPLNAKVFVVRPGDSTPKFDNVQEASDVMKDPFAREEKDPQQAKAPSPAADGDDETALDPETNSNSDLDEELSDSHVLGHVMIPHYSDGTTDIIKRGSEGDLLEEAQDNLREQFPQEHKESLEEAIDVEPSEEQETHPGSEEPTKVLTPEGLQAPEFQNQEWSVENQDETVPLQTEGTSVPRSRRQTPGGRSAGKSKANLWIILLASYASAVTLALGYLLMTRTPSEDRAHQLESLPDPLDLDGKIPIYKRNAQLPPGHTLKLKESRRFGNIIVEPIKVTLAPIKYQHFSGDRKQKQQSSEPVLCLWLKFTNVSQDQQIAPLDSLLLFKRVMTDSGDLVANTFLISKDDSSRAAAVLPYPHAPHSEFDLMGQNLGYQLKPGESIETYIPCDSEGMKALKGSLVWRVHFRKGYAKTGHGVTTLIDVVFHRSEVQSDQSHG